eukprot:scaffold1618_cov269-Chaetoceros_neogracile.AAC.5
MKRRYHSFLGIPSDYNTTYRQDEIQLPTYKKKVANYYLAIIWLLSTGMINHHCYYDCQLDNLIGRRRSDFHTTSDDRDPPATR